MRLTTKKFTRLVSTAVQASTEEIETLEENKTEQSIRVGLVYKDREGEIIYRQAYIISEGFYTLIMSESPDFAPGKPANEYREVDIWHIIDMLFSLGEDVG